MIDKDSLLKRVNKKEDKVLIKSILDKYIKYEKTGIGNVPGGDDAAERDGLRRQRGAGYGGGDPGGRAHAHPRAGTRAGA